MCIFLIRVGVVCSVVVVVVVESLVLDFVLLYVVEVMLFVKEMCFVSFGDG